MRGCFLGVDTSNYRTSAALYDPGTGAWENVGRLLEVPEGAIGLRQSEALFKHTVRLHGIIEELPEAHVFAIGVSTRPRAVEGSYMPCFLAGENVARSAAHLMGVPVYAVSHQQGHIAAAVMSVGKPDMFSRPFLAWHLSGGTSELLLVKPGGDGLPDCECVGGTTDLAAGQLIDRTGALLNLRFPSGAEVDRLAQNSEEEKGYKVKVTENRFSLSGIQNQIEAGRKTHTVESVSRYALETVANAVIKATKQALEKYPYEVLCAGGVMASVIIRKRFMSEVPGVMFAEPELSGDNAVGAAVLASMLYGGAKGDGE